ncbi:MAG TPA: DUF4391 domain-containing protein [Flavobacteriaceae bacterium]|nr:DUF4391 domain-containing protein [Flavobacteriaceae bacterium]
MFQLPKATIVDRFIPKNSFDQFINTKQKNAISEYVKRINWVNRLSLETINLSGSTIQEIQIFSIELKAKNKIRDILNIIDKAIPYHIIFIISFEDEIYISTSAKHSHVNNENQSVIDYTFDTEWLNKNDFTFKLELKNNLDWIFKNFCELITNSNQDAKSIQEFVDSKKENDALNREIEKLKAQIKNCKQFNKKVELNLKLKQLLDRIQ